MDARERFRDTVRTEVAPALRELGYVGSGLTFRKRNHLGDWAVINIQKSAWRDQDTVAAYVNLSIVPEQVRQFAAWYDGSPLPRQPSESSGIWRARLHPMGSDCRWGVDWEFGDGSRAHEYAQALIERVQSRGAPVLEKLLDRHVLLRHLAKDADSVEFGNLMHWSSPAMSALVLSSAGPSDALELTMNKLRQEAADGNRELQPERLRAVVAWIEERISKDTSHQDTT